MKQQYDSIIVQVVVELYSSSGGSIKWYIKDARAFSMNRGQRRFSGHAVEEAWRWWSGW